MKNLWVRKSYAEKGEVILPLDEKHQVEELLKKISSGKKVTTFQRRDGSVEFTYEYEYKDKGETKKTRSTIICNIDKYIVAIKDEDGKIIFFTDPKREENIGKILWERKQRHSKFIDPLDEQIIRPTLGEQNGRGN